MTANTRRGGRPRSFDRDAALEAATRAFWEHGYEATSIAELTRVMGIGAPSLYAAFGDKRALFREVVAEYVRTYGARVALDPDAPTARDAVAKMLRDAAVQYTAPGQPRGCLIVSAATNCTEAAADVAAELRAKRNLAVTAIEERIAADVAAGRLPADTSPRTLAVFYGATMQGMTQQARDGATREDLLATAELALGAWRPVS